MISRYGLVSAAMIFGVRENSNVPTVMILIALVLGRTHVTVS